jgi:hypothetical protein
MKLKRLSGGCFDGTCPTIYESDRGTIVVQGYTVNDTDVVSSDVTLAPGETLVEIPPELLEQIKR